jgi:hypothetical protein
MTNNSSNNTMTNNSSNNSTTYTPYDWGSCVEVTPSGALADLLGQTFDITDGCVGTNPFADLLALCDGAIVTNATFDNWSGRMSITDDGYVFSAISNTFDIEAFVPEECVTTLGGGSCDGLAGTLDAATGFTTTTCADENTADCLCNVTGAGGSRGASLVTDMGDGMLQSSYNDPQDDGSFVRTDEDWVYTFDGTTGENQRTGDTLACRLYHLTAAADPSDQSNPGTHCPHAQETATAPCQ